MDDWTLFDTPAFKVLLGILLVIFLLVCLSEGHLSCHCNVTQTSTSKE